MKRSWSLALAMAMLVCLVLPVLAKDDAAPDPAAAMPVTESESEAPAASGSGKATGADTSEETYSWGVDVSEHQGNIDWTKAAASGVEFAFIRTSFQHYESGKLDVDSRYQYNLTNARANGIKIGAYIFSQAITADEAREQARYLIQTIEGFQVDLPLVLDYEYAGSSSRLYNAKLTQQQATDVCLAFCDEIEKQGYEAMVYANNNMLSKHLYADQLEHVWLAHYDSWPDYAGDYDYWQFTSGGSVPGISGRVDLNICTEPNSGMSFQDVRTSDWYYSAVKYAYENGLITGTKNGYFDPDGDMSRGAMVTMLYRLAGTPKIHGRTPFTDLTESWYQRAVLWAWNERIVGGVSGTSFAPNDSVTREAMVTMLYKYAGQPKVKQSLDGFTDKDQISDYAVNAMRWAIKAGILTGSGQKLNPGENATRAEACAILTRYIEWAASEKAQ